MENCKEIFLALIREALPESLESACVVSQSFIPNAFVIIYSDTRYDIRFNDKYVILFGNFLKRSAMFQLADPELIEKMKDFFIKEEKDSWAVWHQP